MGTEPGDTLGAARVSHTVRGVLSVLVVVALQSQTPAYGAAFDHSLWDSILANHVITIRAGTATQLNYAGVAADRATLGRYLDQLATVTRAGFDSWGEAEQLAFLINAYNAWTVELILTEYPDLKSIRELGSLTRSPWQRDIAALLGEKRTLDEIEHTMIRGSGRYDEPRIHFAVNCASIGCPALLGEAFRADALERQLESVTKNFLMDRSRNRIAAGKLEVSPLFKWYREDFASGWRGADSLAGFLGLYADALGLSGGETERLDRGDLDITFGDYDWSLNDTQ